MQAARFLVLPSLGHDMFPTTVLEAFSSRLPVICSALPSLSDLVEAGVTGLTFSPGDANALASQVRRAISNPSLLDALAARAHTIYEERYTPEVNFDKIIGIYRSVAPRSMSRRNTLSLRASGAR